MTSSNASNTTIPAPWSWTPSAYWDGNDGSWNSFIVQVGTPPQQFRVLPSTNGQETWVLNPAGCTQSDPSNCPLSRGALGSSIGFQVNESSTWQAEGIYSLDDQEQTLGYYGNGLYGFDTVVLGNDSHVLKQTKQVVAGIADKSYYLGEFGLGPKPINFTTFNEPIPNYLSNLVSASTIPSMSFGYTAGAAYRGKAQASLTLGGYDTSRFTPSNVSFSMNADNSRPLQLGIRRILSVNTLTGTSNLLPTTGYHYVDSAVPHIWLPSDAIDAFVAAFGLTYDNSTDLYLINDTMRARHLQNKPTVTFVLSANTKDGTTAAQNIQLPYSAFDQQAGYPFYKTATNYFPIRLAHNSSQYTIGRTFLQEAYLIADWERQNFSISQTSFDNLNNPSLTPILSIAEAALLNQTNSGNTDQPKSGLSGGTIAGIVISVVAALAIAAAAVFVMVRRRRQKRRAAEAQVYEYKDKEDSLNELTSPPSDERAEIDATGALHEVAGVSAKYELGHGDALPGVMSEAVGDHRAQRYELGHGDALPGVVSEAMSRNGIRRYELAGHIPELASKR